MKKKLIIICVLMLFLLSACGVREPRNVTASIDNVSYIQVNFTPYTQGYFIEYDNMETVNKLIDELNSAKYVCWGLYDDLLDVDFQTADVQQGTFTFYNSSHEIVFEFYFNGYLNYKSEYRYCIIESNSIFAIEDDERIDEYVSEIVEECTEIADRLIKNR